MEQCLIRMKCGIMEYKDPQGKSPIAFTKIMKKLNLSREEVELEGKRLGISIPECHFEEKKKSVVVVVRKKILRQKILRQKKVL